MNAVDTRYAIDELASLGGVSRRTVRYYVQERLIPPPLGLGRGNHYTPDHLEQLLRVKALQDAGRTLEEIRRDLRSRPSPRTADRSKRKPPALRRSLWRRIPIAPGVELHIASTVRLPASSRLDELAEWCRLHFPEALPSTDDADED